MEMNIELIDKLLVGKGVDIIGFTHNTKASDYFVKVVFVFEDGFKWNAVIPYIYRRSDLKLSNEQEVANYLVSIKPYFTQKLWHSGKNKNGQNG